MTSAASAARDHTLRAGELTQGVLSLAGRRARDQLQGQLQDVLANHQANKMLLPIICKEAAAESLNAAQYTTTDTHARARPPECTRTDICP